MRRHLHDYRAPALPVREEEPPVRRGARDHAAGPVLHRRGQGRAEGRPEDLHRPAGHDRRRGPGEHQQPRCTAFLLRAQGQAGAERRRHQEPRAELRSEPAAERHLRLHRPGPAGVPDDHQADRPARVGVAGRPLRVRDRPRRQDRLAADHRLQREPRRHRRPHGRSDLWQLHDPGGPGPRDLPEDRRAADQPEADQPEHGHGDPRSAGPRRRAQGRPDRPVARLDLLPPLLPPARRDRDRRPRASTPSSSWRS